MKKFDSADFDMHDNYNSDDVQPLIKKEKSEKFD